MYTGFVLNVDSKCRESNFNITKLNYWKILHKFLLWNGPPQEGILTTAASPVSIRRLSFNESIRALVWIILFLILNLPLFILSRFFRYPTRDSFWIPYFYFCGYVQIIVLIYFAAPFVFSQNRLLVTDILHRSLCF